MAEQMTVKEVHTMLEQYLHNLPDVGVWKAVTSRVMEPKNPFEPDSIRKPRRWFVLFLIVCLAAVGAFIHFNFGN